MIIGADFNKDLFWHGFSDAVNLLVTHLIFFSKKHNLWAERQILYEAQMFYNLIIAYL